VPATASLAGKYLSFFLAGEEYGLPIRTVHEIVAMVPITPVPHTPHSVRGILLLRGKTIVVHDLRRCFGLPDGDAPDPVLIMVEIGGVTTGLAVDSVSEVMLVHADHIEPPPTFGGGVATPFLLGLAKSEGKVRLLLDVVRVLSVDELAAPSLTSA
jgi:purine-binding chemotaxis protein CheW